MLRIRGFEQRTAALYAAGEVPGFVHLSIGQEATAVGACWPLRPTDAIVSNHRGHGHCLAKGADVGGMYAELMGRATGTCGGLGGSMHIADLSVGVYGANGIVGAGLPIAVGVAQGFRIQQRDDVVVAFFGDGAVAQGAFHEAINLAALWRLPIVFMCENNHYAEFSPAKTQHPVPITERAKAYGVAAVTLDGNDVVEVSAAMADIVAGLRAGEGPVLVEAVTYRHRGHYEGDPLRYRTPEELAEWRENDPLTRTRTLLASLGLEEPAAAADLEVAADLREAEAEARLAPAPASGRHLELVTRAQSQAAPVTVAPAHTDAGVESATPGRYRVMDAITDALADALEHDPHAFVAGIDVGAAGNIFGLTRGLHERFGGGRVLDVPISETALVGTAVGAAMTGCQPVVEVMYLDFIGVCFDQIMNQAAKLHFMTGGAAPMSMVIRTQFGSGRSSAAQHSQSLEALLAHIPGLTVVMPSTPQDTYGLLRAAIASPDPVVVIEHRLLYGLKGDKPPADHLVPLGQAAVRRQGADVTVVSWSRMAHEAAEAAELAAAEGIDVELIDLRTVAPFDEATIAASVKKTSRLVIAHEAVGSGGIGAEIAARISDQCIWHLDAPIKRVASPFTPAPYTPSLEAEWLPQAADILQAIREVCRDR